MFLKNSRNSQVKAYAFKNIYFREQLHLRATASGWPKEALIILPRMAWERSL